MPLGEFMQEHESLLNAKTGKIFGLLHPNMQVSELQTPPPKKKEKKKKK